MSSLFHAASFVSAANGMSSNRDSNLIVLGRYQVRMSAVFNQISVIFFSEFHGDYQDITLN